MSNLLYIFFIFNFHWSIVDLQCISFRCTAKLICYTYTYIPSFWAILPYITLQSPECYTECCAIQQVLKVIYFTYSNVYMSIPISQFISPLYIYIYIINMCVMCSVALVVSDSLRPMDCNTPISSVIGILQARILERVAIPSFRRSSQDQTHIS